MNQIVLQSVEVNIEMSINMHFYTGWVQNTVFHKDQFKISYNFLSTYVIAQKLFMENINNYYLQMILINIY